MSKVKPQTVETILDWLEKATDAKLASKSSDVIASWAASGHLKQATLLLGVFQVRDSWFGATILMCFVTTIREMPSLT
jgi:hypothetical protein